MGVDKRIGQPLADNADELLNADTNLRHGWMNLFMFMIDGGRTAITYECCELTYSCENFRKRRVVAYT